MLKLKLQLMLDSEIKTNSKAFVTADSKTKTMLTSERKTMSSFDETIILESKVKKMLAFQMKKTF